MRSQRVTIPAGVPKQLLQPNSNLKFLQIRNADAAATLGIQFGGTPGEVSDFFPLKPGDVETLDPYPAFVAMIASGVWVYCPSQIDIFVIAG